DDSVLNKLDQLVLHPEPQPSLAVGKGRRMFNHGSRCNGLEFGFTICPWCSSIQAGIGDTPHCVFGIKNHSVYIVRLYRVTNREIDELRVVHRAAGPNRLTIVGIVEKTGDTATVRAYP